MESFENVALNVQDGQKFLSRDLWKRGENAHMESTKASRSVDSETF